MDTAARPDAVGRIRHTADGTAWVEAGAGEPLVLVHGVGMNHAVWAPQIADLATDYRVIAYDLLGHGSSPLPPDPTRLDDLRRQLASLLDELDLGGFHLAGHSMGALVAVAQALESPDRVRSLVALNAVYRRTPEQRAAVRSRAQQLAQEESDDTLEAILERWFAPDQRAHQPECVDRVRNWLTEVEGPGYARVYGCFAEADEAFAGRLQELAVPALFLTGELDPNSTPAMSRQMAAEARDGHVEIIADQRHMMAYVEPEQINPRIRAFLEGADVRGAEVEGPAP